jgi:hypothetical protein
MYLQVYEEPLGTFASDMEPGPVITVPVMQHGRRALEDISQVSKCAVTRLYRAHFVCSGPHKCQCCCVHHVVGCGLGVLDGSANQHMLKNLLQQELGLGFDDWDLDYYTHMFRDDVGRDPTNVELFDIAQARCCWLLSWLCRAPHRQCLFSVPAYVVWAVVCPACYSCTKFGQRPAYVYLCSPIRSIRGTGSSRPTCTSMASKCRRTSSASSRCGMPRGWMVTMAFFSCESTACTFCIRFRMVLHVLVEAGFVPSAHVILSARVCMSSVAGAAGGQPAQLCDRLPRQLISAAWRALDADAAPDPRHAISAGAAGARLGCAAHSGDSQLSLCRRALPR